MGNITHIYHRLDLGYASLNLPKYFLLLKCIKLKILAERKNCVHTLSILLVIFIRQKMRNLSTLWLVIQEKQGAATSFWRPDKVVFFDQDNEPGIKIWSGRI